LINNRQGGRRRGRGGQGGGRNLGGQPGNRQDNRQRGNAAQLLEKYKAMARDSQLAGDRVQTEYYLQFADHYFRVLGESRSRFDEQNPRRQRDDNDDSDDDHQGQDEMAEADAEGSGDEREERDERFAQRDRPRRDNRESRDNREDRGNRQAQADSEPARVNGGETIPFDVLPPAIGRDDGASSQEAAEEEPRKPRRRTRAPRPEGEDEIAPAA
jgi:hypothetical protein